MRSNATPAHAICAATFNRWGHSTPEELAALGQAIINMATGQSQVIRGFITNAQPYEPVTFPVHAAPKVSIVIPVHNKFATTYTCLASIAAAQCKATYEVIVVDDGSKDETLKIKDIVSNVKVVPKALWAPATPAAPQPAASTW
jgi:hypothetical protein